MRPVKWSEQVISLHKGCELLSCGTGEVSLPLACTQRSTLSDLSDMVCSPYHKQSVVLDLSRGGLYNILTMLVLLNIKTLVVTLVAFVSFQYKMWINQVTTIP